MLKDRKSRTLGQLLLDYDGCDFIRVVNPFDIVIYQGEARGIFDLADVDKLLSRYVNYYDKRMDGLGRMYIYIKLFINGENDEEEKDMAYKKKTLKDILLSYSNSRHIKIYANNGDLLFTGTNSDLCGCGSGSKVYLSHRLYYVNAVKEYAGRVTIILSDKQVCENVDWYNNIRHDKGTEESFISPMTPKIEKVILSGPATIVFWNDGTKTVVKCKDEEEYDPEKGILWAIAKKYTAGHPKTYNNYIMFIDGVTNHMEYHGIDYPKYPEWFSAKEKEKKKYKRHFGDSSQTCPHCGGNWVWSNKRRMEYYTNGFIDIPCRHCGKTFRICE